MRHITTPRILTLALILALHLPVMGQKSDAEGVPSEEISQYAPSADMLSAAEVQISVSRKTVHVRNAQGLTLEVYNLTGVRVATCHIDSPDKQFTLNLDKGLYILRVGNLTRKVQLS